MLLNLTRLVSPTPASSRAASNALSLVEASPNPEVRKYLLATGPNIHRSSKEINKLKLSSTRSRKSGLSKSSCLYPAGHFHKKTHPVEGSLAKRTFLWTLIPKNSRLEGAAPDVAAGCFRKHPGIFVVPCGGRAAAGILINRMNAIPSDFPRLSETRTHSRQAAQSSRLSTAQVPPEWLPGFRA
jgi:hypothetical protein